MARISPLQYRWPFLAKFFFFGLLIFTLAAPIPYVFFKPGVPDDVTGNLITINDAKSYPVNGKLYLTSILVTNPDAPVLGIETIMNWAIGPHVVLPREVIYPPAVPGERIQRDSRDEMAGSRITSTAAALRYLGFEIQEIYYINRIRDYSKAGGILQPGDRILSVNGSTIGKIEDIRSAYSNNKIGEFIDIKVERQVDGKSVILNQRVELVANGEAGGDKSRPAIGVLIGTSAKFPIDIDFNLRGVGGPSAGLIFAIGIVEKMTPEDLLRGRSVAGTGAITPAGKVQAIGGIEEKMVGASRKGVAIFLAPRENCPDIKHVPKGLKVIPVSTLSEAISALRAPDNFRFPTC